ncbi:MAG TPA: SMP-30/gluconolactonase/LRE family protein [Anaerolineaceae bacterium]|nr:SMP-30/gluconolactonase/LRE family protein [Anaerolineaceae bacterium]
MAIEKQVITQSLINTRNKLGESPVWSTREQVLYWTDIEEQLVFRFNPETSQFSTFELPSKVGSFGLVEDSGLILAVQDGFAFWDGYGKSIKMLQKTIPEQSPCMMNDGKVDPMGRFWAGSKGPKGLASLWFLEKQNRLHKVLTGLGISNGLDWGTNVFYFTDSLDARIYRYDYDLATGQIENPTVFFESPKGVPDGLCIDREGNVWSAIWDGWKVIQLSPEGKILSEIELPVQRPTSLCFGGPTLQTIFITSASVDLSDEALAAQPMAGHLFAIETKTSGRPCNYFKF